MMIMAPVERGALYGSCVWLLFCAIERSERGLAAEVIMINMDSIHFEFGNARERCC